ncbi:hypothetical protein M0802_001472 [Mischocyttarus mexicanus]|nr:hypothetical protein M0802_001472 [Mischocyttarus mexicanus]
MLISKGLRPTPSCLVEDLENQQILSSRSTYTYCTSTANLIPVGDTEGAATTVREFVTRDYIDCGGGTAGGGSGAGGGGGGGVLIRDCTSSPATWRQEVGGTMCVTATPLSAIKIVKDNARQGTRTTTTTNNNNNITTHTANNTTNAQTTQVQGSHGTVNNVLTEMDRPQHTSIM